MRMRARIAQVGLVVPTDTRSEKDKVDVWLPGEIHPETNQTITLWEFDCQMLVPLITITSDGTILIAGHAVDELHKISQEYYGGIKGRG